MTHRCHECIRLMLAWMEAPLDTWRDALAVYQAHLNTCPQCSAWNREQNEQAKAAVMPELEGE